MVETNFDVGARDIDWWFFGQCDTGIAVPALHCNTEGFLASIIKSIFKVVRNHNVFHEPPQGNTWWEICGTILPWPTARATVVRPAITVVPFRHLAFAALR